MISYDASEFTRLKQIIKTTDIQIAATELNIQAAIDGQFEWLQIAFYEKVIEADVVTGIQKVTPTLIDVLLPSDLPALEAEYEKRIQAAKAYKKAYDDAI